MSETQAPYTAGAESAHTPGPWEVRPGAGLGLHSWTIWATSEGRYIGRIDDNDQGEANARLIAAAPDLLAACREALDLLEERSATDERAAYLAQHMADAIAKAEGRAS